MVNEDILTDTDEFSEIGIKWGKNSCAIVNSDTNYFAKTITNRIDIGCGI